MGLQSLDITDWLINKGITATEFVKSGCYMGLVLLSAVPASGYSNMGLEYEHHFITSMGDTAYSSRGIITSGEWMGEYFNLDTRVIKLREAGMKYKNMSVLFNLLMLRGLHVEAVKAYDFIIYADVSSVVSFNISRATPMCIRNLKDILMNILDDKTLYAKGKMISLRTENEAYLNKVIVKLREQYGNKRQNELVGNMYLETGLGLDEKIKFFRTDSGYAHMESLLYVRERNKSAVAVCGVRVTVSEPDYNFMLSVDDIDGYTENEQNFISYYEDMRAGIDFTFAVVDAWLSVYCNKVSLLSTIK